MQLQGWRQQFCRPRQKRSRQANKKKSSVRFCRPPEICRSACSCTFRRNLAQIFDYESNIWVRSIIRSQSLTQQKISVADRRYSISGALRGFVWGGLEGGSFIVPVQRGWFTLRVPVGHSQGWGGRKCWREEVRGVPWVGGGGVHANPTIDSV